jgi:SAM-dependent methyltransferase
MSEVPYQPPLLRAREEAALGLPLGRPTRFRTFKRIILRISWLFLNHQIAVNNLLLDNAADQEQQLIELKRELAELRSRTTEQLELGIRQVFREVGDHIAQATVEQTLLNQQVRQLEARIDPLDGMDMRFRAFEGSMRDETTEMHLARAEANIVIDRIRRALPEPVTSVDFAGTASAWDDLYLPFENVFRGSSDLIKSRLSIYLTDLEAIERGDRLVLDIGCGRGDWLELLNEEGINAYGVDADERSVELAIARKLDVRLGDAFAHMSEIPAGSLAAITGFHLVEHVSTDDLVTLLDLAFRDLMPGGLLILETPNPENFVVSSTDFYMDPTHRNPIPPPLLAFLTGSRGFADTKIRRLRRGTLSPAPPEAIATLDPALVPIFELLQSHLLAGEDYAVVARRP